MKNHFLILSILLLLGNIYAKAQDINAKNVYFKYKKQLLIVGDKNYFKLKDETGTCYEYFYDLETNEEVMFFCENQNGTTSYFDDDYIKITFSKSGKSLEMKVPRYNAISILCNNGVITPNAKINEDKIDAFISKYDESKTIKHN